MTVTYSLEVSQARVGGFLKLLFRWRGSIYRLLYKEMIIFVLIYYAIMVTYRYLLSTSQRRTFELLSWYMKDFTELVPITFVLGFYVSLVVKRWWDQYLAIPWIDKIGTKIGAYVQGADEKGRLTRRGLVRYLNLMSALTFQSTSTVVKRRFPSVDHLEDAGLMTAEERIALEEVATPHGNWWVPGQWFAQLAMAARKEGRIYDDLHLQSLLDEMLAFRSCCGTIWSYDWISIPLVYTQVVTIAVYSFFIACLFGRQFLYQIPHFDAVSAAFLSHNRTEELIANGAGQDEASQYFVDFYFPVFTLFQFFFYMGWLKVAEEMICPFGEDDDDFELNWVLDRNVQVGYQMVDGMFRSHPRLVRDVFWDDSTPKMPYTCAAASFKTRPHLGSTMAMNLQARDTAWENEMGVIGEVETGLRRRHPKRTLTDEGDGSDLSPQLKPKFLNGLLKGDSRHSVNNSLNSGMETAGHSPSLLTRRHSAVSHLGAHFRRHRKHSGVAFSGQNSVPAASERGSLMGSEEELGAEEPPSAFRPPAELRPSACVVAELDGGDTSEEGMAEDFVDQLTEAPVVAYDNRAAATSMLDGVVMPPSLLEVEEEDDASKAEVPPIVNRPSASSSFQSRKVSKDEAINAS